MSNVGTTSMSRRDRESPELFKAIKSRDEEKTRALLADPNIDVNMVYYGDTPLTAAIQYSTENIVKLLLAHPKIDPNYRVTNDHNLPIIIAIESKNVEIVKLLLEHPRIKVNVIDEASEFTPLTCAIYNKSIEIVKLLLEHPKINVNKFDRRGDAPFLLAATESTTSILELLMADPRVNVNIVDSNKNTALMSIVESLDNTRDNEYISTEERDRRVSLYTNNLSILLSNPNIDTNIQNSEGKTAYDLADYETKKLFTDPARSIAEIANQQKLPPEVTAKIFGQVTGKEPSMENYLDRQFDFKQRLAREAREKQKNSLRNIGKSNKGGRKTRRKPTSVRYSHSVKTRSSKKVR